MSKSRHDWMYAPLGWLFRAMALLPLRVLYLLSDALYILVRHVVRYRRKVVAKNLRLAFPEMSDAERRRIEKQFYLNFTDYFVETIKLFHISDKQMRRRMEMEDVEIIDRLLDQGKSVVCYFSHCGNWEWAPSITLWSRYGKSERVEFGQVYRPLSNEWFDRLFLKLRSRFGSVSYPKKSVLRDLIRLRRDGRLSVCGFMSDQKPSHGDPTHVVRFLTQPTAMISGTETLVRKLDTAAVYFDIYKTRRGHYRLKIRLIADNPAELPAGEITRRYAAMLQETIVRNPAIWLWTHRRWRKKVKLPVDQTEPQQQ